MYLSNYMITLRCPLTLRTIYLCVILITYSLNLVIFPILPFLSISREVFRRNKYHPVLITRQSPIARYLTLVAFFLPHVQDISRARYICLI